MREDHAHVITQGRGYVRLIEAAELLAQGVVVFFAQGFEEIGFGRCGLAQRLRHQALDGQVHPCLFQTLMLNLNRLAPMLRKVPKSSLSVGLPF